MDRDFVSRQVAVIKQIRGFIKDEKISAGFIARQIADAIHNHQIHEFAGTNLIDELVDREAKATGLQRAGKVRANTKLSRKLAQSAPK